MEAKLLVPSYTLVTLTRYAYLNASV